MTTICWDGKTLAADRGSWSGYVVNEVTKLFPPIYTPEFMPDRFENGWPMGAFAFAGHSGICMAILHWARCGHDKPILRDGERDNSYGVLATNSGVLYRVGGMLMLEKIESVPFADGGGHECALGAMLAGADARRAVEIVGERMYMSRFGVDTWCPAAR